MKAELSILRFWSWSAELILRYAWEIESELLLGFGPPGWIFSGIDRLDLRCSARVKAFE